MALLLFKEEIVNAVNENPTTRPDTDDTWGEPDADASGQQPCEVTFEADERTPEEDGYGYGV
jgi:hypothetical protein